MNGSNRLDLSINNEVICCLGKVFHDFREVVLLVRLGVSQRDRTVS